MPLLRSHTNQPDAPLTVDEWRPQQFRRGIRSVKNPIIEPAWNGVRVLARLELGRIRFFDEDGIDCTNEFADLAEALANAALSDDLVLDGFLTIEPTQPTVGTNPAAPQAPGAAQMMATMFVGERAAPKSGTKRHLDTDQPIAFVAVDLLHVDESDLLDLPLMERKRLLDGALRQDERIRITPFVRPPIESFGNTWRGMGFEEIAYKGENSRYTPGRRNDEWTMAPIPKR